MLALLQVVGKLRPEIAEELGLSPDVVVAPGSGDNQMSALGAGAVKVRPHRSETLQTWVQVVQASPQGSEAHAKRGGDEGQAERAWVYWSVVTGGVATRPSGSPALLYNHLDAQLHTVTEISGPAES